MGINGHRIALGLRFRAYCEAFGLIAKGDILLDQLKILSAAVVLVLAACNDDGFRGSGDGVRARRGNIDSVCAGNAQASQGDGEISGLGGTKIKVSGEFCTVSLDAGLDPALTVLFVVDFSGSMEGADPGNGQTCGRLDAANTVLRNIVPPGLTDQDGNPPLVNVGAVSFDQSARQQVPLTPVATVGNAMTFQNFCASTGASTNYEDGFRTANEALSSVPGNKVIYFISDGLPTSYGSNLISQFFSGGAQDRQQAKQRGIDAASALRLDPATTLNVLFLQNNHPDYTDPLEPDPRPYLQQVAPPENGVERVVIAQNANELASKIQLLERPDPSEINGNGLNGILEAQGFSARNVKVKLENKNSTSGRFRYVTDEFKLFGRPGETVVNTLRVTATASDGTRPESRTTIRYTQETSIR